VDEAAKEPGNRLDAVVELAAQGQTDREIAEALGISPHTVDTYWKRLRARWDAKTRAEVVVAHLREGIARREREMEDEIARLQAVETAMLAENARLHALCASLTEKLRESQRQEANLSRLEPTLATFERTTTLNRVVAYELSSLHPVVYTAYSASAKRFGLDPRQILAGESTFYDILYPEDLDEILRVLSDFRPAPGVRHLFLYRALVPEPRWILDLATAHHDESGAFTGLSGIGIDVHELVEAGLLQPKVTMVVASDPSVT
jgi:DNA-binding CsgD family transcriptional regulator